MVTDSEPPAPHVTVNQLVAYNMASFRKAAGITQETMGEMLGGWSAASVSAAERSWDGKRIKRFDADEIVRIAWVLGVPLVALFLPPPDDEETHFAIGQTVMNPDRVVGELLIPDNADDRAVMAAYRERWNGALRHFARNDDPEWARLAARWLDDVGSARAERVARLRSSRDALRRAADEFADLAAAIEGAEAPQGDEDPTDDSR